MKKNFTKHFITGLLGLLPIMIALYILIQTSQMFLLGFTMLIDSKHPLLIILSIFVSLLFIFEIGRQINNRQQNVFVSFGEKVLSKFPIIDKVISIIKDFVNMLQGKGKFENLGVARVPFGGGMTNALITNVKQLENGHNEYTVFIVTGTFPPVGFVSYYIEDQIEIKHDMTAKDVFELQITLGISKGNK